MSSRKQRGRGQAVVEFALILPLMFLVLMAIVDFARIYTTMMSVESAAREAADYGAFGSQRWQPAKVSETEAEMQRRACIATSNLPEYQGDDATCTNPGFTYSLDPATDCDNATREPPCRVTVTLTYTFRVFTPFRFEFFGTEYGLPSTLPFSRSSTFAMSDIQIPED